MVWQTQSIDIGIQPDILRFFARLGLLLQLSSRRRGLLRFDGSALAAEYFVIGPIRDLTWFRTVADFAAIGAIQKLGS